MNFLNEIYSVYIAKNIAEKKQPNKINYALVATLAVDLPQPTEETLLTKTHLPRKLTIMDLCRVKCNH